MSSNKIIGIDLGTTNSVVAVMEGGQPVVIVNQEGKRTTPSVVSFKEGERKVGDQAKRQALTNPEGTVYSAKRFIGRSWEEVSSIAKLFPYKVQSSKGSKGSKGRPEIVISDKAYAPAEISAAVLQKLKNAAENYLGHEVTRAVITVPAYFNDAQRTATKEAGTIAGLTVERVINEPTAAALAYGLDKVKPGKVAVFDLGGGTFDISIVEMEDGVTEVISTDGDSTLGGDDFDAVLVKMLQDEFKRVNGVDLTSSPQALQRLRDAAESAKIELSSSVSTQVSLPYLFMTDSGPLNLEMTINRSTFEKNCEALFERCMEPVRRCLANAKLSPADVSEVLLVGGSTRIPAVQKMVEDFFKKAPNRSVNPDEVVALGAAVQGAVLSGDASNVILLDVTSLSYGIETSSGEMARLVESNQTIPLKKTKVFSTATDNQPSVEIHVGQGERAMMKDNKSLGRFHLDGIPLAPRGVPQIEVTFDIDANGILTVSAKDVGTGKVSNIRIEGGSSMSKEEIERMKQDAELNAEADRALVEQLAKLNAADSLVYSTESFIRESGDKLDEADRQKLGELMSALKGAHASKDMSALEEHSKELTAAWNEVSSKLYSAGAAGEPEVVDAEEVR